MSRLHELRRQLRKAHQDSSPPPPTRDNRRTPAVAHAPPGGPGTELKTIFERFSYTPDPSHCQCEAYCHIMDRLGPVWCSQNLTLLKQKIFTEFDRRAEAQQLTSLQKLQGVIAKLGGIEVLLKLAIRRAVRKGFTSRVFLLGYPGAMGGANTEALHLLKLWHRFGWEVHLIPTWSCDKQQEDRLTALGFHTHHAQKEFLHEVPNLAGSVVVGMCNPHFVNSLHQLHKLGCKTVWLNCMTFLFPHERQVYSETGLPDAFVFQSQFQQKELERYLVHYGYNPSQGNLIHGAFDLDSEDFACRPRPHTPGEEFVIGKLSRPDADKWPSNFWTTLEPVLNRRVLAMGCRADTYLKIGSAPDWGECFAPMALSVPEFLGRCHALFTANGGARENWPRVGLEAMAAGVPIVAPDAWGWREMIEHGVSGFLVSDPGDYVNYFNLLQNREDTRQDIISQARQRLSHLADPDLLWLAWEQLFFHLYAGDVL